MKAVFAGLFLLHIFVGACTSLPMQGVNAILGEDECMQLKRETLISIEVKGTETWITSYFSDQVGLESGHSEVQTSSEPKKLNGRISPGCGDKYFRCRDLLVETITHKNAAGSLETNHILFIPLESGVHLVELIVRNDSTVQFGSDYGIRVIGQTTQRCSPSALFKIDNNFYSTCINFEENSLYLYQIRLNMTSPSQSYMQPMSTANYIFRDDQNIANASNFLYMEWDFDTYIFFAIDNLLYAIRPSEASINDDYEPIGATCTNVQQLALTGNDGEILAYCDTHLVYYSIDYADWTLQDMYANAGRRYVCPDRTLHLSVFREEQYITYNYDEGTKEVTVSDTILDGVCYSSANSSYFAYIEEGEGLFVLDTLTATVNTIMPTTCLNTNCHLLLVEENYLIVQSSDNGGGRVWVRDTSSANLSVVLEAQHASPDLLTLVVDTIGLKCVEPTVTESETPIITHTEGEHVTVVVTAPVTVVLVLIGIIGIISGVILALIAVLKIHKRRRDWSPSQLETPSMTQSTPPEYNAPVQDHNSIVTQPVQEKDSQNRNCEQVSGVPRPTRQVFDESPESNSPLQETNEETIMCGQPTMADSISSEGGSQYEGQSETEQLLPN